MSFIQRVGPKPQAEKQLVEATHAGYQVSPRLVLPSSLESFFVKMDDSTSPTSSLWTGKPESSWALLGVLVSLEKEQV